jgi:hypothetical protein
MFLSDADVTAMTGLAKGKHRPATLRRWLEQNGYTFKVDFFARYDGWYSVMDPRQRAATVEPPRGRVRERLRRTA